MSFDSLVGFIFVCVQWRITVLWMRAARRRWPARMGAFRAAITLFDLALTAGYFCTFSDLVGRLGIPGRIASPVGAAALGYLMGATGSLIIYEIFQGLGRRFDVATNPGRRRLIERTGAVLMAVPAAALGYGCFIGRSNFQVREVDVPVPHLAPDLEGLRILQLSDIHLSAFLSEDELAQVVDMTAGLHPHIAVVTGDLISGHGDPLDACIRQLARLKADAGVFGCMGNHERYAHAENYTKASAARVGMQFLRQESRQLRFGNSMLNLAGVDYQSLAGKQHYLRGAEKMVVPGTTNILLSHNPDVFPVAERQGYNLVIAGHTHGGQVTVEILEQSLNAARFITPYVYGLYRRETATAYVTRGIGTIAIPTRIGAPPEISLLRLRKA